MATYRVVYSVDVEASTPREAALGVERLLRSADPERFRPIFEIYPWRDGDPPYPPLDGSEPVVVDLDDPDS